MKLREAITGAVDKELGKGTTMSLSKLSDCGVKEWVSTGSVVINAVIHRAGIPVGRLTTIAGKPASGKSSLSYELIRSTQEAGGLVVLADTEHTYDPARAAAIGVKNEDLLFYQDLCLEDAFAVITRIADVSIKSGSSQQITFILDSHSSTPTRAEVNADADASRGEVASSARVTSLHLRRLTGSGMLERARIALVFVCQIKSTVMSWGAGETYLAKYPIDYHSSLILKLRRKKVLEKKEGILVGVKVAKNKVGPPFAECEVDVLNDTGLDECRVLFETAIEHKLVKVSGGGWYELGERRFRRKEWVGILQEIPSLKRELFGLCTGVLSGD